ncbi:olfactory receptor 10H1-like [Sarcophilus harrisii]|uniref:olfactory receptor 10H1-like n=1 Tax=Sarcophilus harrisii TaxID=9305 RepID=UPI001301A9C7|nr:olfactory receptor 10H1-like [Sarcophilus harrisii]
MLEQNHTTVTEFILIGFSPFPQLQLPFFVLFLLMYLFTLLGNLLVMLAVWHEQSLHKPMYFFLCTLSISEIAYTMSINPRMFADLVSTQHTISFWSCASQMLFTFAFGLTHCFLLTIMGYDRYVAICHPLRYNVLMSSQVCVWLVASSWLSGIVMGLVITLPIFNLTFCGPNEIHYFFCHVPPMVKLACGDASAVAIGIGLLFITVLLGCFLLILLSYIFIVATILKIPSAEGQRKAFSTCASHIIVVIIHYAFSSVVHFKSKALEALEGDTLMGISYSVLTPFLNPIIFSLRNKELKDALKKVFLRNLCPSKLQ